MSEAHGDALVFDGDLTLVDSVHVAKWQRAVQHWGDAVGFHDGPW